MIKNHNYDLVLVEWYDAAGGHDMGWRSMEDVQKTRPALGRSVGWLIHTGKLDSMSYIVVCPHIIGTENIEGDGEIAIPKSWIKKITKLQPLDKSEDNENKP